MKKSFLNMYLESSVRKTLTNHFLTEAIRQKMERKDHVKIKRAEVLGRKCSQVQRLSPFIKAENSHFLCLRHKVAEEHIESYLSVNVCSRIVSEP